MGINMAWLQYLDNQGIFRPGCEVLDIGSSNLYQATPDAAAQFIRKWNPSMASSDVDRIAGKLAAGSTYVPGKGGTNEAFAGVLFEAAGMRYLSFDIANGYKTEILDMNRFELPAHHRKKFGVVVNFGTTEHIFNQVNSFNVIHDAATVGGYIFHQLPSIGFVDHCYFTYTSRFFFDLASANDYEICDMSFGYSPIKNDVHAPLRSHSSYFPALEKYHDEKIIAADPISSASIPDVCINVLCRKVHDRPFRLGLESGTSVGTIPDEVRDAYRRPITKVIKDAYRSGSLFSVSRIGRFAGRAVKKVLRTFRARN